MCRRLHGRCGSARRLLAALWAKKYLLNARIFSHIEEGLGWVGDCYMVGLSYTHTNILCAFNIVEVINDYLKILVAQTSTQLLLKDQNTLFSFSMAILGLL